MGKVTKVNRYFLWLLLALNITTYPFSEESESGDMIEEYKATLYALGAVPVAELDRKWWGDDAGNTLYFKGERVDVNGWVASDRIRKGNFLTNAEKERAQLAKKKPLTFAQYVSLIDIAGYRKNKEPLQYAIMAIALDNMLMEGIKIENPDDIIKVYEAGIGLEERALQLLKTCMSSDRAMQLYNKHADTRLLDVFPVPRPGEEKYIQFLREVPEKDPERGWLALSLLYAMNKSEYKEEFRDFLIHRIRAVGSWSERLRMYNALIGIGDGESLQCLASSLSNDPVTEAREGIIRASIAANLCGKKLVDSVVQLAKGLGEKHQSVTPSRMADQWEATLREYLMWVKDSPLCDAATRSEAGAALELLQG